jgi:hypothetical protein
MIERKGSTSFRQPPGFAFSFEKQFYEVNLNLFLE